MTQGWAKICLASPAGAAAAAAKPFPKPEGSYPPWAQCPCAPRGNSPAVTCPVHLHPPGTQHPAGLWHPTNTDTQQCVPPCRYAAAADPFMLCPSPVQLIKLPPSCLLLQSLHVLRFLPLLTLFQISFFKNYYCLLSREELQRSLWPRVEGINRLLAEFSGWQNHSTRYTGFAIQAENRKDRRQ